MGCLHERLGRERPYDPPEVEDEKRAAVEAEVEKIIKERRRMPTDSESSSPR